MTWSQERRVPRRVRPSTVRMRTCSVFSLLGEGEGRKEGYEGEEGGRGKLDREEKGEGKLAVDVGVKGHFGRRNM